MQKSGLWAKVSNEVVTPKLVWRSRPCVPLFALRIGISWAAFATCYTAPLRFSGPQSFACVKKEIYAAAHFRANALVNATATVRTTLKLRLLHFRTEHVTAVALVPTRVEPLVQPRWEARAYS